MNKLGMKILSHTGIKQQFFRKNQKFSPKNKKKMLKQFLVKVLWKVQMMKLDPPHLI